MKDLGRDACFAADRRCLDHDYRFGVCGQGWMSRGVVEIYERRMRFHSSELAFGKSLMPSAQRPTLRKSRRVGQPQVVMMPTGSKPKMGQPPVLRSIQYILTASLRATATFA